MTSVLRGFLNLYKPSGVTSRWVVDRVAPLARPAKAGHAGTLDPLAAGVLVVGVGPATRLIAEVQSQPKTYRGSFRLGCMSDTEDVEGEVVALPNAAQPTRAELEAAAQGLVGVIQQTPPAFSALKVGGRRAYQLARQGAPPELAPREVVVHELTIERYEPPNVTLHVRCGAGTYIRTLGRDLARACGSDAVMTALERTAVGPFLAADALPAQNLDRAAIEAALLPIEAALGHWPQTRVSERQAVDLRHGRAIELQSATEPRLAALDERGQLVALLERRAEGRYWPTLTIPV